MCISLEAQSLKTSLCKGRAEADSRRAIYSQLWHSNNTPECSREQSVKFQSEHTSL